MTSFLHRQAAIPIRPATTLMTTCFPMTRSPPFGGSIHETSLLRSIHSLAPHWCCGEYNISRLLIAHSCWTYPSELSPLHIARLFVGITSVRVRTERRMKMGPSLAFEFIPAENTTDH